MITKQKEEILNEEIFNIKNQKTPKMNKFLLVFYTLWNSISQKKQVNSVNHGKEKFVISSEPTLTSTQIKANQFIEIKEYDLLISMMENGYELLPNQKIAIENYMADILVAYHDKEVMENNHYKIEKCLSLGLNLDEKIKNDYFKKHLLKITMIEKDAYSEKYTYAFHKIYPLSFFCHSKDNMKSRVENEIIELPILTEELKRYIKESKIVSKVFISLFNSCYKETPYKRNFLIDRQESTLVQMLSDERKDLLLKELNFESFLDIVTEFNKNTKESEYQKVKTILQKILKNDYKNNIDEIVSNVKEEYADRYIEKAIIQYIKKDTETFAINNLPNEVQHIVKDIQLLHKKTLQFKLKPSEIELYNMDKLYNERVPEIIKKYLTIDDQYKTTLTNANGKNAQQLMTESLENIKSNFEQTWENINKKAVNDLSATHKYTKVYK